MPCLRSPDPPLRRAPKSGCAGGMIWIVAVSNGVLRPSSGLIRTNLSVTEGRHAPDRFFAYCKVFRAISVGRWLAPRRAPVG